MGTRLWPLSRLPHPKPFIDLPSKRTLIGETYKRVKNLDDVDQIVTVTNASLLFKSVEECNANSHKTTIKDYILEPFGRGTAAAISLSALYLKEKIDKDATILVLPADHIVQNEINFKLAVDKAKEYAKGGRIVTFGVVPTRPDTRFGYIQHASGNVLKFIEKPTLPVAQSYLDAGCHLWNSGMLCFQAEALLSRMEEHCPDLLRQVGQCFESARKAERLDGASVSIAASDFEKVDPVSIDYALMEKLDDALVVPCDIGWSDVGSHEAMSEFAEADENHNRSVGEVRFHRSENVFAHSDSRMVNVVGASDLIVVDTEDVLLVAGRNDAADIKSMFDCIKSEGHEAHRLHRKVHRPWGSFTLLEDEEDYKVKKIVVKPGGRLNLQTNQHYCEHCFVVNGRAHIINGNESFILENNESIYIRKSAPCRLENLEEFALVLIEMREASYFWDNDIVRYEDAYDRV